VRRLCGDIRPRRPCTKTAALARAFGVRILAVDPLLEDAQIRERGAEPVDLETLTRTADIVSLHCPRDKTTLNLFDYPAR
jgi:D-3-phosphoglycerate dehydrogenase